MIIVYIILALIVVCIARTLYVGTKKANYEAKPEPEREREYAEKLSKMVQKETVSVRGKPDPDKFRAFHGLLRELFPKVFEHCEYHDLEGSMVLKWKGKTDEKPVMFLGHMDVVEASTPDAWKYPPFSGTIAEGRIWGRGSGDTKCSLFSFLQAAEELIGEGFVPDRDIYLASSNTEEIGGDGAPRIAKWLSDNGVHLEMLCDEGGSMVRDPLSGVKGVFAMVGLFEKGYGDVKFTAKCGGGHSSTPKKGTPIPKLAKFICRVERKTPFKARFCPALSAMMERLAPYCSFGLKLVMSNLWFFKPVIKLIMKDGEVGAMLKTTICFTMQKGSDGYNVIPREASATANLRFIPHQKKDESLRIITKLAAKYGLETEVITASDPTTPVDLNSSAFKLTEANIAKCFPGVGICPYIATGGTDSRFFNDVCDNLIRFSPVLYGPEALSAMHGVDEHLDTNTLPGAVDYFKQVARTVGEL